MPFAYLDSAALHPGGGNDLVCCGASVTVSSYRSVHSAAWQNQVVDALQSLRIGIGVDVHTLLAGRPLWLAGLHWADSDVGLAGHSDGDVVAHAICDAVLAAARLGDLGSQFGTSDPEWSGASGVALVTETARRLRQAGVTIGNVSAQIIGNQPKLCLRRDEAERILTEALGASVSLSATTTDGLGLTGRGEGVAAIATALVQLDTRP